MSISLIMQEHGQSFQFFFHHSFMICQQVIHGVICIHDINIGMLTGYLLVLHSSQVSVMGAIPGHIMTWSEHVVSSLFGVTVRAIGIQVPTMEVVVHAVKVPVTGLS